MNYLEMNYASICLLRIGIEDDVCAEAISTYELPKSSLREKCEELHQSETHGVYTYRRLLPANYADGLDKVSILLSLILPSQFYISIESIQMFDSPLPKNISDEFFELTRPDSNLVQEDTATFEGVVDATRNIALVQWSQFIEHDLVKTVFRTMSKIFIDLSLSSSCKHNLLLPINVSSYWKSNRMLFRRRYERSTTLQAPSLCSAYGASVWWRLHSVTVMLELRAQCLRRKCKL